MAADSLNQRVVIILVLLEDTLRDFMIRLQKKISYVIILVLLEDTLRERIQNEKTSAKRVIILVLLEDTLRDCNRKHQR